MNYSYLPTTILNMKEYAYFQKHMGTEVSVSLVTTSATLAAKIAEEIFATVAKYEQHFSRFLPNSELSLLNSSKNAIVTEEFFTVLEKSYQLYKATVKIFNPLVEVARLGYQTNYENLKDNQVLIDSNPYNIDFDLVLMDKVTKRVILHADQKLDFGGILKGYLAEKLSKKITEQYPECQGNIVNLGGDLHTEGTDENGEPFIFQLYNPVTKTDIPIALTDTSLVTSGTYKRTWETSQGLKNHILSTDGKSNPETNIISASVIHPDGAQAEAYAKVLLIDREATARCAELGIKYLIINNDGKTLTNII